MSKSPSKTCPLCGKNMFKRDGPHGPFFGCSGFPVCRGTRDLDEEVDEGEIGKTLKQQNEQWDKSNELDW